MTKDDEPLDNWQSRELGMGLVKMMMNTSGFNWLGCHEVYEGAAAVIEDIKRNESPVGPSISAALVWINDALLDLEANGVIEAEVSDEGIGIRRVRYRVREEAVEQVITEAYRDSNGA